MARLNILKVEIRLCHVFFETFSMHGMDFSLRIPGYGIWTLPLPPHPSTTRWLFSHCPSATPTFWFLQHGCSKLLHGPSAALSEACSPRSYHGLSSTPFSFSSNIVSLKWSFLTTVSNMALLLQSVFIPLSYFIFFITLFIPEMIFTCLWSVASSLH